MARARKSSVGRQIGKTNRQINRGSRKLLRSTNRSLGSPHRIGLLVRHGVKGHITPKAPQNRALKAAAHHGIPSVNHLGHVGGMKPHHITSKMHKGRAPKMNIHRLIKTPRYH